MNKVRALEAGIYESKSIGNCSNHGISERFSTVYIICPDGNYEFDLDEHIPENLVRMVTKYYSFGEYSYVEPVNHPGRWWMSGGSFIFSCDSRFIANFGDYPLSLHDRYEG